MVKTQIQFPDHLYREAKRVAVEYEMSFAEVVRRGVEAVVKNYPPGRGSPTDWQLPESVSLGEPLLPEEDWDLAGRDRA